MSPLGLVRSLPRSRLRLRSWLACLLLVLALSPALQAASVAGFGHLPTPTRGGSAVWTGEDILFLGGAAGTEIRHTLARISPVTGAVTVITDALPGSVNRDDAFWDARDRPEAGCPGGCLYVPGVWTNQVTRTLKYNPSTNQTTFLNASHPSDAYGARVVWTGEVAYLFGGVSLGLAPQPYVYRYDPISDTYATMNATLPPSRRNFAAVWTGDAAFLFGGQSCKDGGSWKVCTEILRYDPVTDDITLAGHLPLGVTDAEAVWDGHRVLLSGGYSWTLTPMDRVIRYDPATGEATTLAPRLPTRIAAHAVVWADDAMFIMGGWVNGEGILLDAITRYTLEPAAPPRVEVFPISLGSNLVSWQPPASDTYSVLTGYRVYRAEATDPLLASLGVEPEVWEFIAETDATTTSFVDHAPTIAGAYLYRVSAINAGRDEGPATTSGHSILVGTLP